ncbi:adenosylmethionine decarboxylase [Desulfovibrio inopinatus]|uniref:adenosylmethionine decarboxylase n=1 Tax=Desulfovibrio inopinatus TaxID=102109 RepID=UPI0009FDBE44|nr:adenosylmethionine decarboxylase [Desulfovibrio inopinatus]
MNTCPTGIHCILEISGCPFTLLDNETFVKDSIEQASQTALSTLLSLTSHKFEPQGVTALGLLAESHISIHTWPEQGYAAVDIFTCGETANPQKACKFLVKSFQAKKHTLLVVPRGQNQSQATSPMDAPQRAMETGRAGNAS